MRPFTKTKLMLALGAVALAACDSSDVVDPTADRLSPSANSVRAAGSVNPSKVVPVAVEGFDQSQSAVTVGQVAKFSYYAYDAAGRQIPTEATVAPQWTSSDAQIFPIDAATGQGTATATGYVQLTLTVGRATSSFVIRSIQGTTTPPANQAPTAAISAPAAGASFTQGTSVTFTGSGSDAEDGALSGAALVWTSSINGQIGTGASFATTTLSVGSHTITLTAKDSKGATGTATRSITVTAPPTTPPPSSSGPWVNGYYVGYQRSMYPETSVDFTYITHITLGTIIPTATGGLDTAFYNDNINGPRMARNLSARAHAAGRKAILMLGGDGYHDQMLGASSNTNRARFVRNLLFAMDNLGYDGIDVDWEPMNSSDEPVFLQLVKDLRAARPSMLITVPIGWVPSTWGLNSTIVPQVAPYADQLNIMSYTMADNWGGWVSWHSAALTGEGGDHPSSVSSSAQLYINAGVPAAKLGIGIGSYGSCWQGVSTMYQRLDGTSAHVTASDNAMTYAAIMNTYYNAAAYKWDAAAQMGYLSFSTPTGPQGCTMISYEDPRSVAAKGAYVKSKGLGGSIVWTVNQGHTSSGDPLLQAIYTSSR